jgi:hypothetical protein
MPLSDELRDLIIQDFLDIFQARYGKEWRSKLTTNLRPSPIYQIAEQRGVSVSDVKKVRSQILNIGHFVNLLLTPIETPPISFDIHYPE